MVEMSTIDVKEERHSDWFVRIKNYYATNRWSCVMVKNAVKKGKITAKEYEEITGKEYKP